MISINEIVFIEEEKNRNEIKVETAEEKLEAPEQPPILFFNFKPPATLPSSLQKPVKRSLFGSST